MRRIAFERRYARELWNFARFVTSSSIITLLLLQCDKLVFGRIMSLDNFGLYILAGNLASAPLAFTSAYSSRVLYPAYAQLWREGHDNLRAQFYAKRRLPSLLYTFAAGGLIGSAPLIVAILYDPRYAGAATYLRLLTIMPLFALASNSANEALTATGRIRVTFQATVTKLVWLAVAGPVGYRMGGELGLVAAVGLMEVPAVLLKWIQMHAADLLDLRQELHFFAAGAIGVLVGASGDYLLRIALV
jgi:O-antigen/teichoic acid export membrane protein